MSDESEPLPRVLWRIPCFDRSKAGPFPLPDHGFVLDWHQVPTDDVPRILAILQGDAAPTPLPDPHVGDCVVTFSSGTSRRKREMIRYRRFFVPASDSEATGGPIVGRGTQRAMCSFCLPDYFEDEDGKPIALLEMMRLKTGDPHPVVLGMPASVMALGPAGMRNVSDWSVPHANTLAQFLEIVDRIGGSPLLRQPVAMTKFTRAGGESRLARALFPDAQAVAAGIVWFRQLYSSDALMSNACNTYMRFVDEERKIEWIRDTKQCWNQGLAGSAAPVSLGLATGREILDTVIYGARLMHAKPGKDDDVAGRLAQWERDFGREKLVLAFHMTVRQLFGYAAQVQPVIRQDFVHWTGALGYVGPDRKSIADFFARKPGAGTV